jgi:hypothetical protein
MYTHPFQLTLHTLKPYFPTLVFLKVPADCGDPPSSAGSQRTSERLTSYMSTLKYPGCPIYHGCPSEVKYHEGPGPLPTPYPPDIMRTHSLLSNFGVHCVHRQSSLSFCSSFPFIRSPSRAPNHPRQSIQYCILVSSAFCEEGLQYSVCLSALSVMGAVTPHWPVVSTTDTIIPIIPFHMTLK